MITQSGQDIPFDLHHIRHIKYEFTPRGMQDFESKLMRAIQEELSIEPQSDNDEARGLTMLMQPTLKAARLISAVRRPREVRPH
jgi:hypothetical protein